MAASLNLAMMLEGSLGAEHEVLEASLLMCGLCRSAPSALCVSFVSSSGAARLPNLKGEP